MSSTNSVAITTLGNTGIKIAKISHGLMLMSWRDPVVDDETAFASIKAGLDLLKPGEKVYFNSGEFYGNDPKEANLQLVARFFGKYPEYQDRVIINVKGGVNLVKRVPDSSYEYLRSSVLNIIEHLGPRKLDVFEPARLDGNLPVEEIATNLAKLRDEGLFSHIGLSEVRAETLRRACKVTEIVSVKIEVSPWSYDQQVKDVIATAKDLGVTVLAYSPLGNGFLTGKLDVQKFSANDVRTHRPRLQAEAAAKNQKLVDLPGAIASKKGVTNAQLCIAWVSGLGDHVVPLPGMSKDSRTLENFAASNIILTEAEKKEMDEVIESFQVTGDRYPEFAKAHLMR